MGPRLRLEVVPDTVRWVWPLPEHRFAKTRLTSEGHHSFVDRFFVSSVSSDESFTRTFRLRTRLGGCDCLLVVTYLLYVARRNRGPKCVQLLARGGRGGQFSLQAAHRRVRVAGSERPARQITVGSGGGLRSGEFFHHRGWKTSATNDHRSPQIPVSTGQTHKVARPALRVQACRSFCELSNSRGSTFGNAHDSPFGSFIKPHIRRAGYHFAAAAEKTALRLVRTFGDRPGDQAQFSGKTQPVAID